MLLFSGDELLHTEQSRLDDTRFSTNGQNKQPEPNQEESVVHARRGGQSERASEAVELGTKGDVDDDVVESVAQSAHPSGRDEKKARDSFVTLSCHAF